MNEKSSLEQCPGRIPWKNALEQCLDSRPSINVIFNGAGSEYFRIWIVNLRLSIVTLGIYSAWAKVRTKRYFYGNAELDGAVFEYHATPIMILKGRLIAAAVFVAALLSGRFFPAAQLFIICGPGTGRAPGDLAVNRIQRTDGELPKREIRFHGRSLQTLHLFAVAAVIAESQESK